MWFLRDTPYVYGHGLSINWDGGDIWLPPLESAYFKFYHTLISFKKQCGNHFKIQCKEGEKSKFWHDFVHKQTKTCIDNPMQIKKGVEELLASEETPKN